MISEVLIPLALGVQLLFGAGEPLPTVVGQASAQVSATADVGREQLRVRKSTDVLKRRRLEHAQLKRTHNAQLKDIDRLKEKRASWSRDNKIRSKKKAAHSTSKKLTAVARDLRRLESLLQGQRRALVRAIDRELTGGLISSQRQVALISMRTRTVAALPRKRARKIVIPDTDLDEVVDPDELEEQAALLAQAERQLLQQERLLGERERRYRRMARLRDSRERATQLSEFDRTGVRRSTGRVGDPAADRSNKSGGNGAVTAGADSETAADPAPPAEPGGTDSDFADGADDLEAASVVLADVVDPGTVTALRQADRSTNPRTKAAATGRAREQVARRLLKLRKRLHQIRTRARKFKK